MSASVIVVNPRGLRIPADVTVLPNFRAWTQSETFPQGVRIDYLAGEVDIDMSPEDVTTHGTPKAAVVSGLHALVVDRLDAGLVLTDRTRLTSPEADLSVEPDVLVVLYESLQTERVRLVPKVDAVAGRYTEIEGAADLVVACVSDSSVTKDTRVLPALYHQARIREYWLVDARETVPGLVIQEWTAAGYRAVPAGDDGLTPSPLLGHAFLLVRRVPMPGVAVYGLEVRRSR